MTTQELKNKYLGAQPLSFGHFRVGFIIRGVKKYAITTNTMAIDRIDDTLPKRAGGYFYETQKQALLDLYKEVKQHQ